MMKTEITPIEVVSLLHDMGYRAMYEHQDGMRGVITSASQGHDWTIFLGDVLGDVPTEVLRFNFPIVVNPVAYPVGKICNEYNERYSFGCAYYSLDDYGVLDGKALLNLDFAMSCTGGVSEDWLRDQLEKWDVCLHDFFSIVVDNMDMDLEIDDDSF